VDARQEDLLGGVASGRSLSATLEELCRIVESGAEKAMCSILLLDEDGVHVRHGAAPSLPEAFVRAVDGQKIGPSAGSCGTAAFRRERVVVEDIATDPLWADYRAVALPLGLRACWSTPIFGHDREVLGTFAVYYREPRLPDPAHARAVAVATHTAAIAIQHARAIEKLEESQTRLQLAVRSGQVVLFDWDPSSDRLSFSRETTDLGYTDEEFPNTLAGLRRLLHPDDRPIAEKTMADFLASDGKSYESELRFKHKDGRYRTMFTRAEMIRDPSGKPLRMTGCRIDVTERARAERLLTAQKGLLDGIATGRPLAETLDALCRFIESESEQVACSVSILGSDDPEVRQGHANPIHGVGNEVLGTLFIRSTAPGIEARPDPKLIDVAVRVAAAAIQSHRATEDVRASERRLRFALAQSRTGGWDLDLVDHTAFHTLEHDRIYGYDAPLPRWTYEMFLNHVLPEDRAEVDRRFREARKRESDWSFECRIRRTDGAIRWIWASGGHQKDANGRARRMAGILQDITERREAEEEVRRLNADLEQRVIERTAKLAAAEEQALAADRLKSAFLATMSHELRTPLNSIIGFTGTILQGLAGPLTPEQKKQLGMVQQSGRHLLALVSDVLDLSKIEAGELKLDAERFELGRSLATVVETVRPLADKKALALRLEAAPTLGAITGDQRRFEQVLLNLLTNAIKFTERGEVALIADAADGVVQFRIRDTGIGIKPEDMSVLFKPFQQIDSKLSRAHEGTGLGLAICRRLVDLMGGEIRAESEWKKGSTFIVVLPHPGGQRA
jgi:PAS domain S-box-containing protein